MHSKARRPPRAPEQPAPLRGQRAHPAGVASQHHALLHLRGRQIPHADRPGRVAAEHLRACALAIASGTCTKSSAQQAPFLDFCCDSN